MSAFYCYTTIIAVFTVLGRLFRRKGMVIGDRLKMHTLHCGFFYFLLVSPLSVSKASFSTDGYCPWNEYYFAYLTYQTNSLIR